MEPWFATLLLVAARVASFTALLPGVDGRFVPWRIRLILIGLLSAFLGCVVHGRSSLSMEQLLPAMVQEACLGMSLALVPTALIFGLQVASESVFGMTGLASDQAQDPTQGNPVSRLFWLLTIAVFFAASGHRQLLQALLDSFVWTPPGEAPSLLSTKGVALDVLQHSFHMGVRVVAPLAAALAISTLALAAINRVLPQLGYFAIGMSIQSTVLLASLVIMLGSVGLLIEGGLETSFDVWHSAWSTSLGTTP